MRTLNNYKRTPFHIRLREFNGNTMMVEVTDSPYGRMRDPEITYFNPELLPYLSKLGTPSHSGRMTREEMVVMGQIIGDMLFPTRVRRLFFRTIEQYYAPPALTPQSLRTGEGKGIRVLLEIDDSQLVIIPWEYCYIREFKHFSQTEPARRRGFLGLDDYISILRYEPYANEIQDDESSGYETAILPDENINVLFCAANPYDFSALNLVNEFDRITFDTPIQDVPKASIHTKKEFNITSDNLDKALQEKSWHIFHFSGHAGYLSRSAVSKEGQIYSISAENHRIDEKPSEDDRDWERRVERVLRQVMGGAAGHQIPGTSGPVRGVKHIIDPSRGVKHIIDPSRGVKHIIDPSRGVKHIIDPSRGVKHIIDPSRGLTSDVYDSLDRKEGLLLLEQRYNTHNWQITPLTA